MCHNTIHAAASATSNHAVMPTSVRKRLSDLKFDDTFVRTLPADAEEKIYPREVRGASYSFVKPTNPAKDDQQELMKNVGLEMDWKNLEPGLIAWSKDCAKLFDLDDEVEKEDESLIVKVLGGFGTVLEGMKPYSACYGGHQFGAWAGQLGDGRAITLGEYVNANGERWEMQLKGAGLTPYSRSADGRAVLRSSIREFLCSEAMHHLGLPTTRALALIGSGTAIVRDKFYQGDPKLEHGAVVTRVAPTFLRLGNFQLPASRGDIELMKKTADYAIEYHFPQLKDAPSDITKENSNRYGLLLQEVIRRNAEMVAGWQSVGFVHGVMNTDNLSILGLCIDYGPFGWLDEFDPHYTPNTTDIPGRRYCFGKQPQVTLWNLLQFAQALVPLCGVEAAQNALNTFQDVFDASFTDRLRRKFGFDVWNGKEDEKLGIELHRLMEASKMDFTNTWRGLSKIKADTKDAEPIEDMLPSDEEKRKEWDEWVARYVQRMRQNEWDDTQRMSVMDKANPKYILRNYMTQDAISLAERGDYSEVSRLLRLIKRPYVEQEGMDKYAQASPSWSKVPGVCVNSCSS